MQVVATIRIGSRATGSNQDECSAVDEAKSLLEREGFVVFFVGHDTLDVEVSEEDFRRTLGVSAPGPRGMSSSVSPRDRDLSRLIDLVEVYPVPQYAI